MLNKNNINSSKQILLVYVFLTITVLAVYWQVNRFDFINLDDYGYVTQNRNIQSGLTTDGVRWAFSTRYADLWHPVTWLSFILDYQFHGLNPAGYHLTNLILHLLSTLLLFWLFCRMTGEVWKSAFVAALFALHPLHVESVAWIAERKDVLSAFFWMLTLCFYVYYTEKPGAKRYLPVMFAFVLALLSKPMVVTLPLIMILLDYWPLNRFESKKDNLILWQLKEKLPFFVLSTILVIITLYNPNSTIKSAQVISLGSRLANAPVAFISYLGQTFWPYDLAVYYPFLDKLSLWQVLGASFIIIVITIFVLAMMKRLPCLLVGWLWYAVTLLPVLGIIQISFYSMADRYHYLSSIGIAVGLAWGIPSLIRNKDLRQKILFPLGWGFLFIMAFITWRQCGYWKNTIELLSHTLKVTEDNYLMHLNRGDAYDDLGQYENALKDYNEAIRIRSDYAEAYYNKGYVYAKLHQYQKTIENCGEAIRLNPYYADAYFNRGSAYAELGRYENAIDDFNKTLSIQPDNVYVYLNRASAYFIQGKNRQGCIDVNKACSLGECGVLEAVRGKGYCR